MIIHEMVGLSSNAIIKGKMVGGRFHGKNIKQLYYKKVNNSNNGEKIEEYLMELGNYKFD